MIERPDNRPRSVARVLVEMPERYAGRVYDPACGFGGIFTGAGATGGAYCVR